MPVIATSTIASVTDLAATLSTQLADGRAGRATLGTRDQAFGWTTGAPPDPGPVRHQRPGRRALLHGRAGQAQRDPRGQGR